MTCTDECRKAFEAFQKDLKAFGEKWPNHCDECGGWGGFASTYDPSPAGVGLSSGYMWDFDPCTECEGKCPLCGGKWNCEEGETCPHCKTKIGSEGRPEPPECLCWMQQHHNGEKSNET